MIINVNFFGHADGSVFDTVNVVNDIYRMELMNGLFHRLHTREGTSVEYNTTKESWQTDSIILLKFIENLEGGNVHLEGIPIEFIKIRKRLVDKLTWEDVVIFPFNNEIKIYNFIDKYLRANYETEYAVVPIGSGGFEGQYSIGSITPTFDGLWISDANQGFKFYYNLEYGTIDNIQHTNIFEPFSKYPIIVYGPQNYKRGQVKSLILSQQTIDKNGEINLYHEQLNKEQTLDFFKNKKPKFYKDGNGNSYLVAIYNTQEMPNNNLNQQLNDLSFEWIEIAEISYENLQKNALI